MKKNSQLDWSRISALKPALRAAKDSAAEVTPRTASQTSKRLTELLEGELLRNQFGDYICVKKWFADAAPNSISQSALRILAPKQLDQLELLSNPREWLFLDTETTGLSGGTG